MFGDGSFVQPPAGTRRRTLYMTRKTRSDLAAAIAAMEALFSGSFDQRPVVRNDCWSPSAVKSRSTSPASSTPSCTYHLRKDTDFAGKLVA